MRGLEALGVGVVKKGLMVDGTLEQSLEQVSEQCSSVGEEFQAEGARSPSP